MTGVHIEPPEVSIPLNTPDWQGEIASLSVDALAQACRLELKAYATQKGSQLLPEHGIYGYELFRRAIEDRDDLAWDSIYEYYGPLLRSWIKLKMTASVLLQWEGEDVLLNGVLAKFAQSMTAEKMRFCPSLASCLSYLKLCVMSVTADTIRTHQARQYEASLTYIEAEPASGDLADDVVNGLLAQQFWRLIQEELHDEKERLVIVLTYGYDMPPRDICRYYPRVFPSTETVHRIKRNVLARLQRNTQFKQRVSKELAGVA